MSLRGWSPGKEIASPRGMYSYVAGRHKGNPSRASWMQNMRVQPAIVVTRPAVTPTTLASTGKMTALFNWIAPNGLNHVLWQDGAGVSDLVQDTGAQQNILAASLLNGARASSFADVDVWTYFCGYGTGGLGVYQARVFDGVNTDIAFRGPIDVTSADAEDNGPGQCTAGTHYIGFVYQNRTGFSTTPTIADPYGNPFSVTLNAGLRQIAVTALVPAQTDAGSNPTGAQATVFLIMTRADNPNEWYWVPPAAGGNASVEQQPLPLGISPFLNFVADISDEDLAGYADPISGPNANPNQFLLNVQDADGNGPFLPSQVLQYGTRMCYVAGSTLWVSDQMQPQQLRTADSFVLMPNQRAIGVAFTLPGGTDLYLSGDHWTGRVTDNSDTPSTWSEPVTISTAIGAPLPNLVCAKTGGAYIWLVSERGVDQFTGTYGEKPITYLVQDVWARVNWAAAYVIQIADDVYHNRLYVGVPLDGATECTHCFCIDYTNGQEFDTCDISLDFYGVTPVPAPPPPPPTPCADTDYPFTLKVTDSLGSTASVDVDIYTYCTGGGGCG